ncbi:unnamed protein product [Prunus armeniaca]
MQNVDSAEKAFASFSVNTKNQNKNSTQTGPAKSQTHWQSKNKPWDSRPKPQHTGAAQNSNGSKLMH